MTKIVRGKKMSGYLSLGNSSILRERKRVEWGWEGKRLKRPTAFKV